MSVCMRCRFISATVAPYNVGAYPDDRHAVEADLCNLCATVTSVRATVTPLPLKRSGISTLSAALHNAQRERL